VAVKAGNISNKKIKKIGRSWKRNYIKNENTI